MEGFSKKYYLYLLNETIFFDFGFKRVDVKARCNNCYEKFTW